MLAKKKQTTKTSTVVASLLVGLALLSSAAHAALIELPFIEVQTIESTAVEIDLLAEVSANYPAASLVASQPEAGTVGIDTSSGIATYTPIDGFTGVDTFSYQLTPLDDVVIYQPLSEAEVIVSSATDFETNPLLLTSFSTDATIALGVDGTQLGFVEQECSVYDLTLTAAFELVNSGLLVTQSGSSVAADFSFGGSTQQLSVTDQTTHSVTFAELTFAQLQALNASSFEVSLQDFEDNTIAYFYSEDAAATEPTADSFSVAVTPVVTTNLPGCEAPHTGAVSVSVLSSSGSEVDGSSGGSVLGAVDDGSSSAVLAATGDDVALQAVAGLLIGGSAIVIWYRRSDAVPKKYTR